MPDEMDKLASKIIEKAADTTRAVRRIALRADLSADEALTRLETMFRDLAKRALEEKP
jgi:hypothetical protein